MKLSTVAIVFSALIGLSIAAPATEAEIEKDGKVSVDTTSALIAASEIAEESARSKKSPDSEAAAADSYGSYAPAPSYGGGSSYSAPAPSYKVNLK